VPCDKRDLNYDKYFTTGNVKRNTLTKFDSNNTERLNVEQVKEKLLSLPYIRNELEAWGNKYENIDYRRKRVYGEESYYRDEKHA
jgi:UDP-glucose 4-epimerase